MADNDPRAASATSGTLLSVATDDIGGVHYQRFKIHLGADGVAGGDVTPTNPLPIRPAAPTASTLTIIATTATPTARVLLNPNARRRGGIICNSTGGPLYLSLVTAATTATSATAYSLPMLANNDVYELSPDFTLAVTSYQASTVAGRIHVTEWIV